MRDTFFRYFRGFIEFALISSACRTGALFDYLREQGEISESDLAITPGASSGELAIALRLLKLHGWVKHTSTGSVVLSDTAQNNPDLPEGFLDLYRESLAETPADNAFHLRLLTWVECSGHGWRGYDPRFVEWLDAVLVISILGALPVLPQATPSTPDALLIGFPASIRAAIEKLFAQKGWIVRNQSLWEFTAAGHECLVLAPVAHDLLGFGPVLLRLREQISIRIMNGSGGASLSSRTVMTSLAGAGVVRADGLGTDLKTALGDMVNALSSAAVHPEYVVVMGCADAALLECIQASIDLTAVQKCELLRADCDTPESVLAQLSSVGVTAQSKILYIDVCPGSRRDIRSRTGSVLALGCDSMDVSQVTGAQENTFFDDKDWGSLGDYFRHWADIGQGSAHIVLEIHPDDGVLNSSAPGRLVIQSVNALRELSGQCSVELDELLLAAASVGLFPASGQAKVFSSGRSLTRISLHCLERRPYSIRHPRPDDLAALIALEQACWSIARRSSAADIERRITVHPQGQFVLMSEGLIAGAIYSQRISAVEVLTGKDMNNVWTCHNSEGPCIQLLAVNVLPSMQHLGLGDQLLEFVLQCCAGTQGIERVVAVSLCKEYPSHATVSMAEYIQLRDESGLLIDPILRFHDCHGASIEGLVPGYRSADHDNQSNGVLVAYDIRNRKPRHIDLIGSDSGDNGRGTVVTPVAIPALVEDCIRQVLGAARAASYATDSALMQMGMDSLDMMRLRAQLSRRVGFVVEGTFFFRHGTPVAIAAALVQRLASSAQEPEPGLTKSPWQRQPIHNAGEPIAHREERAEVSRDDIAIIGCACRFPGGVTSANEYWDLLREGRDAIGEVPASRWDPARYHGADVDPEAAIATRRGGFIGDVDQFDAAFFGISPREANLLDPQQRLLLEVSYEALEHAGIASDSLRESKAGIFAGVFSHDYELLQVKQNQDSDYGAYYATGNAASVAAGRLAYVFGLRGPALTIDTACSSSLVAIHLACQSLHSGETTLALAGGVNLLLSPELSLAFSRAGMLSPDGRCKTFDAHANGYVRSEGCGIVVLKPLRQALRDNDNVLAVIQGTAINQDGASNGLTAPNQLAQEEVIRDALSAAAVHAWDISYVEAHGTATPLGDPVEMQALGAVYGEQRPLDQPLIVGSVKTNIGHTEAAAGVAGLMKVALSLQHGYIPPHLHYQSPNPHLDLAAIPAAIPEAGCVWERPSGVDGRRIAGVSSFGFSGTNAHVILGEAPTRDHARVTDARTHHALVLSAKSATACRELAARYAAQLLAQPELRIGDVCYSAAVGRNQLSHRLGIVAASAAEAARKLTAAARGVDGDIHNGITQSRSAPHIAFLFTGQGSQAVGMARELYDTNAAFRSCLERCEEILRPHCDMPLLDVIFGGDDENSALHQTAYTQPALFALEYSLAQLWMSWGVTPDVVMGHSVGEYVAACIAGVMSLEDSCRLIAARARLMQALPAGGAMAAVFAPPARVRESLEPYAGRVSIAAVNGPENVVISGAGNDVREICAQLQEDGLLSRPLQVSHAFHSQLMEPMLDEFRRVAQTVQYAAPTLELVSNVTGCRIGDEIAQPEYWVRHVRQPVQFAAGMGCLNNMGVTTFLEIGPRPVLLGMGRKCLGDERGQWLPSLHPDMPDWERLTDSVVALSVVGVAIDWKSYYEGGAYRKLVLPSYPFERKRYWLDPPAANSPLHAPALGVNAAHPLLGRRLVSPLKELQFESRVSAHDPGYLIDHCVFQRAVLPAAAFTEMAVAVCGQLPGAKHWSVTALEFSRALELAPDQVCLLQSVISPSDPQGREYHLEIFSCLATAAMAGADWQLHSSATLRQAEAANPTYRNIADLQSICKQTRDVAGYYASLSQRGYHYGPAFRAIQELWHGGQTVLAKIELPIETAGNDYVMHPILLDGCFHAALALTDAQTLVPAALCCVQVAVPLGRQVWAYIEAQALPSATQRDLIVDLTLIAPEGMVVASLPALRFVSVDPATLFTLSSSAAENFEYVVDWRRQPLQSPSASAPVVLESPERLLKALRSSQSQNAVPRSAMLESLEALSSSFVAVALRNLGQALMPGTRFTTEQAIATLGITARQQRQFGRLLEMLAESGVLRCMGSHWDVVDAPDENVALHVQRIQSDYPQLAAELEMLSRCGHNLAAVLKGDSDPLQLLFPDGELGGAARFYEESPTFKDMNAMIGSVIESVARHWPPSRPLRILEIGAGTGGLTAHILPRLPAHQSEYVFTDVSNLFLNRARDRFGQYPFVRYQLLDIERAPAQQSYPPHHFDMVISANVLHATRDLTQTLCHVRDLLAPGGLLLLLEGTARRRWIDLIFGLTEGWWRFSDAALRTDHPLLTETQWSALLDVQGFTDATTACPERPGARMLFKQSIVMARAPALTTSRHAAADLWLLFADDTVQARALAQRITDAGAVAIMVCAADRYARDSDHAYRIRALEPGDYQRLLAELAKDGRRVRGVAHLWSLGLVDADEVLRQGVSGLESAGYGSLLCLVQAMIKAEWSEMPRLWLVTRGARTVFEGESSPGVAQALLWGMAKVIALEHPELRCACIDLDPHAVSDDTAALWDEMNAAGVEDHVAFRGGERQVARLVGYDATQLPKDPPSTRRLDVRERGTLDELTLSAVPRTRPGRGEIEIQVHAAGLNFRDVLNALGNYPGDPGLLGDECMGEVIALGPDVTGLKPGDRVMATAPGCFSGYVTVSAALAVKVPPGLSATEAATIPVVFLTAYYALHHLARIKAGDRVLIHAASGGVGQAAIQIAQLAGAEVFGTASQGKWSVLERLGVRHIMGSRSLDFADEVLRATDGEGVDIALNCLTGEFIPKTLSVVKNGGCLLEIGKLGIWSEAQVAQHAPTVAYFTIDLLNLRRTQPHLIQSMLAVLAEQLHAGHLRPLPQTIFPLAQATDAFRTMQQAKHTGKIVFTIAEPASLPASTPLIACRSDSSYLITGGLGGLGMLVARQLVEQGAGGLVLAGRSPPDADALREIRALEDLGADVRVVSVDVRDGDDMATLIDDCNRSTRPLRGVIHAVGVLDDGAMLQQSTQRFRTVLGPKIAGAWNLHRLTRDLPLDFFILFSSTASLLGTPGQANHAAANAFLDQLAHHRRSLGLPATSINWGAWSDIGAAARRNVGGQWESRGIGGITPAQGLRAFAGLMQRAPAQIGVVPVDWRQYLRQFSPESRSPFYEYLSEATVSEPEVAVIVADAVGLIERVRAEVMSGGTEALTEYLRGLVFKVLRLDAAFMLEPERSLSELGLDSLTGIELRNRISKDLGVKLALDNFFMGASLEVWCGAIIGQLALRRMTDDIGVEGQPLEHGYEEVAL